MQELCVVIESAKGREALLACAEASLPAGDCLVKVTDVVGMRRSVRTTPRDPRAALVARETPLVLRGGLTSLVSYYRVPADALDAKETHHVDGEVSHAYDVRLDVARVGRAPRKPVVA